MIPTAIVLPVENCVTGVHIGLVFEQQWFGEQACLHHAA